MCNHKIHIISVRCLRNSTTRCEIGQCGLYSFISHCTRTYAVNIHVVYVVNKHSMLSMLINIMLILSYESPDYVYLLDVLAKNGEQKK